MIKSVPFVLLLFAPILACSAFLLSGNGRHIVGKNYDWNIEDGRVIVNGKGLVKTSFGTDKPAKWCSKYGSLTFNQYGMEFPSSGINEKGLVIEALWLDKTAYPPNSEGRKEIDNMQWIQYQLDNSANVNEVIENDKELAFHPITPTAVHYFIADRSGESLIFESVQGIMHHYLADTSNPAILTNDPYDKSIRLMRKCKVFGGTLKEPEGHGSVSRFIQMAVLLNGGIKPKPIEQSFEILAKVRMPTITKWSIVYDLDSSIVYYKTVSRPRIKKIEISKLDFACSPSRKALDIRFNKANTTSYFGKYDIADNTKLISNTFNRVDFIKIRGPHLVQEVEEYLRTISCNQTTE
jgi:choloylglycine hydrolase